MPLNHQAGYKVLLKQRLIYISGQRSNASHLFSVCPKDYAWTLDRFTRHNNLCKKCPQISPYTQFVFK